MHITSKCQVCIGIEVKIAIIDGLTILNKYLINQISEEHKKPHKYKKTDTHKKNATNQYRKIEAFA